MAEIVKSTSSPRPPAPNPWKAMVLHWWRTLRNWFTKEQFATFAKTMSLVGPLTVLIWVYAEREQFLTDKGVPFPIEVRSKDPNRIVQLVIPLDKNIIADLSGPRARLDRVRELLIPRADVPPITIDIDSTLVPGVYELNTAEELSENPMFANAGLSVTNASPPRLKVKVDQLVEIEARVEVPPDVNNLEPPTVFEPSTVMVRGPDSLLAHALAVSPVDNKTVIYVDLTNVAAMKTPGVHENVKDIPLTLLSNSNGAEIRPKVVTATLNVRQSDVEYRYPSMPIWTLAPPDFQQKYEVVFEGGPNLTLLENGAFLNNVPLVGSSEKIEMLKNRDFAPTPKAFLEVSLADLPAGITRTRKLEFVLPSNSGIHVAPQYAQQEVSFKLVERASPE